MGPFLNTFKTSCDTGFEDRGGFRSSRIEANLMYNKYVTINMIKGLYKCMATRACYCL